MVRRPALVVLAIAFLPACVLSSRADELGVAVPIEEPVPVLEGETLDGARFDPAALEGRVVLINFWATWCGPCRQEQPDLNRIAADFEDRGLVVVGVNQRDDPAAARAWVEAFDVPYSSIVDEPGAYANDFGFLGLPATYLVDADGTMRYRILGRIRADDVASLIEQLLADASTGAGAAA